MESTKTRYCYLYKVAGTVKAVYVRTACKLDAVMLARKIEPETLTAGVHWMCVPARRRDIAEAETFLSRFTYSSSRAIRM